MIQLLRCPSVVAHTGRSRSALYQDIADGLFMPPIKCGRQSSGWPDNEVDAVVRARIAGKTDEEIRALVARLVAARSGACDGLESASSNTS